MRHINFVDDTRCLEELDKRRAPDTRQDTRHWPETQDKTQDMGVKTQDKTQDMKSCLETRQDETYVSRHYTTAMRNHHYQQLRFVGLARLRLDDKNPEMNLTNSIIPAT